MPRSHTVPTCGAEGRFCKHLLVAWYRFSGARPAGCAGHGPFCQRPFPKPRQSIACRRCVGCAAGAIFGGRSWRLGSLAQAAQQPC